MTYQKTTGTLSPGGHPGSYNGQDAYNDMLVTDDGKNDIVRRGGETSQTMDASYYKGPGARNGKEREVIAVEERGEQNETTTRSPILCLLQETYGTETVVEWGIAVLDALQQTDILQQGVYESRVFKETKIGYRLVGRALPRPEIVAEWMLRDLRKQQERGRSPQGRVSTEQQPEQPTETLQELPHKSTSCEKDLFDMWEAGEGLGLLQQALLKIQEIRESTMGERTGGGGAMNSVVRRLTPLE